MIRPFWTHARQPESDDCDTLDPLLSLYADGMASLDESRRVESHLPGCASCRQSLLWMQATQRALSGRPIMLPSADLSARIARSLAAASAASLPVSPVRSFRLRPASYAAAASLILAGVLLSHGLLKTRPATVTPVTPPITVATAPPVKPIAPQVSPLIKLSARHPGSKPQAALRIRPSEDQVASSGSEAPNDVPAAPVITPASPVRPRPVLYKQPLKPAAPSRLTAKLPKPSPTEGHAIVVPSPAPKTPDTVVATATVPPASSVPVKINAPIVTDEAPSVVVASLPKTGESRFQTADLLGVVHDYVHVHQTSFERNLSLAGSSAIRATVHTTAMTTGLENDGGKIDLVHSR